MQQANLGFHLPFFDDLLSANQRTIWARFAGDPDVSMDSVREEFARSLTRKVREGRALAYPLGEPEQPRGIVVTQIADWDSEQYGIPLGKIALVVFAPTVRVGERAEFLRSVKLESKFKMLLARVNLLDNRTIQALEGCGGILTDLLMTFRKDLEQSLPQSEPNSVAVGEVEPADSDRLADLGRRIFKIDRFHADPNLPSEKSDELYANWILNSLTGYADATLVARSGGKVVGFITLKTETLDERQGYALIDLVGVDPEYSGKGVGSALIDAAETWAKKRFRSLYVGTQGANLRAIRLYEKNGFGLVSSEATLHLW